MWTGKDFFVLDGLEHAELLSSEEPVWTALDRLRDYLSCRFLGSWPLSGVRGPVQRAMAICGDELYTEVEVLAGGPGNQLRVRKDGKYLEGAAVILEGAYLFDDRVIQGAGTIVEPGALIKGPTVIGANCEIRQGAYVRGDCLVGNGCIVGHTTEMKTSIMLDGARAGHFAYVGDSILGREVNLGAGTKLANLRMLPGDIVIVSGRERFDTGRRKLGAILGDRTETGCNSVTSPGTLMGPRSVVYPGVVVPAGCYPGRTLLTPAKDSLRIINHER
jgi:hypothetical protein